jgi:hypothetical protein
VTAWLVVRPFQREISSKHYPYMKPELETMPWGMLETGVIDPFGNFIRFCQRYADPARYGPRRLLSCGQTGAAD